MNPSEPEIIRSVTAAIDLMAQGSLFEAREALQRVQPGGSATTGDLLSKAMVLNELVVKLMSENEAATAKLHTALMQLEEAAEHLRAKQSKYRELFDNMNDGVTVFRAVYDGQDFVFEDINQAALGIERLGREEAIGHCATEVFPGIEAFGLLDVLRRVFRTGVAENLSERFYQDARISGWREHFVYRLPTDEVVTVYRDISAHKAAETALQSALEIDAVPFALVVVSANGIVRRVNELAGKILRAEPSALVGERWDRFVAGVSRTDLPRKPAEIAAKNADGKGISILISVIPAIIGGEEVYIEAFLDLTERKLLETQLRHAQKLEAVGQLAAGIAHEINTPSQFVGDSIYFLNEVVETQSKLIRKYREAIATLAATTPGAVDIAAELHAAEEEADLAYIDENAPSALERARDGIARISTIVGAMKEFAHPDRREKSPSDLNRGLQATLTIARNEYKYVAELDSEFGDLPPVWCHISEINQVFLNLLVNAAHAIGDVVGKSGNKGRIHVRTSRDGDRAKIEISDTGAGIPEAIRNRIFEPFFTTKEVGKGTGQGLAIARSVVVDKHGGTLSFDSEAGKGTTFTILLPIEAAKSAVVHA